MVVACVVVLVMSEGVVVPRAVCVAGVLVAGVVFAAMCFLRQYW